MLLDECHRTLVIISQHWFSYWIGAIRQQAITRIDIDPVHWHIYMHHSASMSLLRPETGGILDEYMCYSGTGGFVMMHI